ncbi:MAG TPA: hypothetical protein VIU65_04745 [Pyrinomonadaceae bacterium]
MGWMVFLTLMIFYALGLRMFPDFAPVQALPIVAIAFLIIDRLLIMKYRR